MLDFLAFQLAALARAVLTAVEPRASRFLCEQRDCHDDEYVGTVRYESGVALDMLVCAREGCTHAEQVVYRDAVYDHEVDG